MVGTVTPPSDETLYARWRDGDAEAGDALAERYCPALLRFFRNKVPEAAADLVQKTFLACMTNAPPSGDLRSFRAVVYAIARKQLLRHFEGRGQLRGVEMMSRVSLADLATTPTQRIAREEDEDIIHRALATLALDDQIAVELYYWQELSVKEVAESLGLTRGGTRAKLHRARLALRKAYEDMAGRPLEGFERD